jgi:hypothetical protein
MALSLDPRHASTGNGLERDTQSWPYLALEFAADQLRTGTEQSL